MGKFRFELNSEGVKELLRGNDMQAICREYADNAVSSLGDGYEATTHVGRTRCNASVIATTYEARRENAKNNSILKAVGG